MYSVSKQLKKQHFSYVDSAVGCLLFIILQLVVSNLFAFAGVTNEMLNANTVMSVLLYAIFSFMFFLSALLISLARKVEFVEATRMNKKIDYKIALLCFVTSLVCILGFSNLTNAFMMILQKAGYTSSTGSIVVSTFGDYVINTIKLCIIPAIFEETLFRGVVLNGLRDSGVNKHAAVVVSATMFMLMHGSPDQTIHQFIVGVICGYVLVYSGSIWASMLVHFFNNFIAVTALFMAGGVEEEVATVAFGARDILATLMIGIGVATVAGYLVYLIVKKIKSLSEKINKPEQPAEAEVADEGAPKASEPAEAESAAETKAEPKKKNRRLEITITIACFAISSIYLIVSWISELIAHL